MGEEDGSEAGEATSSSPVDGEDDDWDGTETGEDASLDGDDDDWDSTKTGDDALNREEEEVKKVGGWLSVTSIILMIYTAYQMSENPDGICASLCRLVITVVGCMIKIVLIPFKFIMGGRQSGGAYMATPDYRDPYGSRDIQMS